MRLKRSDSHFIPIEFFRSDSNIRLLIMTLEKATGKEFKDIPAKDLTKVTFNFNNKTYELSLKNITQRIKNNTQQFPDAKTPIKTKVDAKNYLMERVGIETTIKLDIQLLQNTAFISSFIKALEEATGKEFKDIPAVDPTKVKFNFNNQTYELNLSSITQRIKNNTQQFPDAKTPIKSRVDAKNYLMEKVGIETTIQLLQNTAFISSFIKALEEATGKEFKDIPATDQTKVKFNFNNQTYKLNLYSATRRIKDNNQQFPDAKTPIKTQLDAKNYLMEKVGIETTIQLDIQLLQNTAFISSFIKALEKATGKEFKDIPITDLTKVKFNFNNQTYESSLNNITERIRNNNQQFPDAKTPIKTQVDAKNYLMERVGIETTMQLFQNTAFISSFIKALEKATGKEFKDIPTSDITKVTFNFNNQTYELSLDIATRKIKNNTQQFPDGKTPIKTQVDAKNYLKLRNSGKSHSEALLSIENGEIEEDEIESKLEQIEALSINDLISAFSGDPHKLLTFLAITNKELGLETIKKITKTVFHGLNGKSEKLSDLYKTFNCTLELPTLRDISENTSDSYITLNGTAPNATHIYVTGDWNRRVSLKNGTFNISIPLKQGIANKFQIFSLNIQDKTRSNFSEFLIHQTNTSDEINIIISTLEHMKKNILEDISNNQTRYNLLKELLIQSVIKKYGHSFNEGDMELKKLSNSTTNDLVKRIFNEIVEEFSKVNEIKIDNLTEGNDLLFFQKYTLYKIKKAIEEGKKGIILANDPGLGKTIVSLFATENVPSVIIAPNSVVPTWEEQADRFMRKHNIKNIKGLSSDKRKEILRSVEIGARDLYLKPKVLTNQEFLRGIDDNERFVELNRILKDGILIIDESHWRKNTNTNQEQGVGKLNPKFIILLTATPYSDIESMRKMLSLISDDTNIKNKRAFKNVFRMKEMDSIQALNHLSHEHVIRWRKLDVFQTFDENIPLDEQKEKLPKKNFMPNITYTLTKEQSTAILELLTSWKLWTEKYGHYIPKTTDTEQDRIWVNNGLVKKHALRNIMNNPFYINEKVQSNKHAEVINTAIENITSGRKVLIFCRYISEAKIYQSLLTKYNPSMIIGSENFEEETETSGDKFRFDENGAGWVFDENGYPIPDENGRIMGKIDYERLTFMKSNDREVAICTYGTGGVGITLNAAKAVIFSDLPDTYTEKYQAEDRAHRIDTDETRTHYDVRYYNVVAKYPDEFIELMKHTLLRKSDFGLLTDYNTPEKDETETAYNLLFSNGTYDEVQLKNLESQKKLYQLLVDGIIEEESEANESDSYAAILRNGNNLLQ